MHFFDTGTELPPAAAKHLLKGIMMSGKELKNKLKEFRPNHTLYKHYPELEHSPGIQFLIEEAEAEWLVCAIASHQKGEIIANRPYLQEFQCWKLLNTHSPSLYCYGNQLNRSPEFFHLIRSTAFPLEEIELLVVKGCLMLPSEYEGP